MTYSNIYATLAEFKAWLTPRSGSTNTDAADDAVMQSILQRVSRFADMRTQRSFFPRYETQTYDVPVNGTQTYPSAYIMSPGYVQRKLLLDDDLLELVTLTNGDGIVTPASGNYNLLPNNAYPKYAVEIIQSSTSYYWKPDSNNNREAVISVYGVFGYRDRYSQRGWTAIDTLGAAITDTTGFTFTTVGSALLTQNEIIKIDTELFNVASVSTTTAIVNSRGDNGSTAANHPNGAQIYLWNPQDEIKEAVLEISNSVYGARSGQVSGGKVTVTAAGVVVRPEDVPPAAQATFDQLRKLTMLI